MADDFAANCNADSVIIEYHVLAYYYGWQFDALRKLPRTYRQVFCHKVQKQIEAENGKKANPFDGGAPVLKSGGKPYKESRY